MNGHYLNQWWPSLLVHACVNELEVILSKNCFPVVTRGCEKNRGICHAYASLWKWRLFFLWHTCLSLDQDETNFSEPVNEWMDITSFVPVEKSISLNQLIDEYICILHCYWTGPNLCCGSVRSYPMREVVTYVMSSLIGWYLAQSKI